LHLLGALMHQSARTDEAISLILQAVAIEPRDADYRYNLGCILQSAGRIEEAITHLKQAVELKPGYAAAHFELSNALARAERPQEAERALRKVMELQPGNAELYNNLGLLVLGQGRRDEAMALWQRALQLQPDLALAHFNIGLTELAFGRPEPAEASLRRALVAAPDHPEMMQSLIAALLAQGKSDDAFRLAGDALNRRETNDTRATYARCLLTATFNPDATTRERLRRAVEEAWLEPYQLAPLCAAVIKAHPVVGPAIERVNGQWVQAAAARQHPAISDAEIAAIEEPLFRAYLEATPNCDIGIERFLTASRANLLDRAVNGAAGSERLLNACVALARQCFVNEYVFGEIPSESERVTQLTSKVSSAARTGGELSPLQLAALAMYRPLHEQEGAAGLLARSWPAPVAALLQQQISEPAQEAALRASTPRLTPIDAGTSEQVRAHYEDNPYPRWVNAISTTEPFAIRDLLQRLLPASDVPALAPLPAPEVLIAGCGTGLQAIGAARRYLHSKILAVDLSTASLAYARRQAQRLSIANVEFAQADILRLGALDRRFDLIEAIGVLHHLADPYAGWRTLLSLLRPGGLMRVALYSEIARRDVVAARAFAVAGNYQPDPEGIRLCRQAILRLPEDAAPRQVLRAADFYSTSAFRDLVLHSHEQRMTLPDIASFLAAEKLEFIGFELPGEIHRAFAARYPDPAARKDLAAWHQFETDNPDSFIGMYVFWLHKPRDA
jgi:Flp pilus assembly protein TadD/SAM-dependent methyltransferase